MGVNNNLHLRHDFIELVLWHSSKIHWKTITGDLISGHSTGNLWFIGSRWIKLGLFCKEFWKRCVWGLKTQEGESGAFKRLDFGKRWICWWVFDTSIRVLKINEIKYLLLKIESNRIEYILIIKLQLTHKMYSFS